MPEATQTSRGDSAARGTWITVYAASFALAIASIVMIGWTFRIGTLISVFENWATTKPNTAIGLMLVAIAMILRTDRLNAIPVLKRTSLTFACFACAIGVISITCNLLNLNTRFDSAVLALLGYTESDLPPTKGGGLLGGRMSIATGLGISSLALGVLLTDVRIRPVPRPHEVCACIAGLIGSLALMGYMLDADELYRFKPFVSLALPTCISLLALTTGLLALRPTTGVVGVTLSPLTGGRFARSMLSTALGLPFIGAFMVLAGWKKDYYHAEFGVLLLAVAMMLAFASIAIITAIALNRVDAARRALDKARTSVMNELDHRVKNNLASLLALADITTRSSQSLPDFRATFIGRVRAMARAHEALAASKWEGVRIGTIIDLTVLPMVAEGGRLTTAGPDVMLPSRASQALCAAIYELATNAVKYGALSPDGGSLRISWSVDGSDTLRIDWIEHADRPVAQPTSAGFGTSLIQGSIAYELQGTLDMSFPSTGLNCRMSIPLAILRERPLNGDARTQVIAS